LHDWSNNNASTAARASAEAGTAPQAAAAGAVNTPVVAGLTGSTKLILSLSSETMPVMVPSASNTSSLQQPQKPYVKMQAAKTSYLEEQGALQMLDS
jgi:hypothetical protein